MYYIYGWKSPGDKILMHHGCRKSLLLDWFTDDSFPASFSAGMCWFPSDSRACFYPEQELIEGHVLLCEAFSLLPQAPPAFLQSVWASIGPGSQPLCLLLILFIMDSCASFRLRSLFSLHSLFKEMPRAREKHLLNQTGRHYKRRRELEEHIFILPGPPKERAACSLLVGVYSCLTWCVPATFLRAEKPGCQEVWEHKWTLYS